VILKIECLLEVDTETGAVHLRTGKVRKPKQVPLLEGARAVPEDVTLAGLITFFKVHPARNGNTYVPKWDKDKALLRPYLRAKGEDRLREMLDTFVQRDKYVRPTSFNPQFVMDQPLTIQGFIACADRLDLLFDWETKEKPTV